MKTPQQEITEILMTNAGNRLTSELIAGMQARLHHVLERALAIQNHQVESEKTDD